MRLTGWLCALVLTLSLGGCGDTGSGPVPPPPPPPLQIASMTPAPDAADVETGATVAVVFNQAIDPATLTAQSFVVRLVSDELATTLSYDAATRTARAAAPLLPGTMYTAEVTTGVRTPADAALGGNATWAFTTRAWQPVTLDATAGVAGDPTSLAVDAGGRLHVIYLWVDDSPIPIFYLQYATCAAACDVAASWEGVVLDVTGDVGGYSARSLGVDVGGRVHVSYYDASNGDLKYATCAAGCDALASWEAMTVDPGGHVGNFSSLGVEAGGRVHVSYLDSNNSDLKYATCAADCDAAASWETVTVDVVGSVGAFSALAVDAGGRAHVSYRDGTNSDLKYATCAADCDAAASWQTVTVDAAGEVGSYTSLAVQAGGRVHVSYYDLTNGDLKYATCAADCDAAASWETVTVDAAGDVGLYTSLAVDGGGRLHVSYWDVTNFDLKYATCAAGCDVAASWETVTLDATGDVGRGNSLGVDAGGRVHVSYIDFTNVYLKYIQ